MTQLFRELITDDATSEELVSSKIFLGQSKSIPEREVTLSNRINGKEKSLGTNIAFPDSCFKNAVSINKKSSVDNTFC